MQQVVYRFRQLLASRCGRQCSTRKIGKMGMIGGILFAGWLGGVLVSGFLPQPAVLNAAIPEGSLSNEIVPHETTGFAQVAKLCGRLLFILRLSTSRRATFLMMS